ncbi:MAG: transposase [Burkholderiaceae bacterium]
MHSKAAPRRRHSDALKAKVLIECDEPGASVAAVAQSHGLNANLVHKWRRQGRCREAANEAAPVNDKVAGAFVALHAGLPTQPVPDIRIELRRGTDDPASPGPGRIRPAECAAWLRQWLR